MTPRAERAWLALDARQQAFVTAYRRCHVASHAAAEAGYHHPAHHASAVLKGAKVREALLALQEDDGPGALLAVEDLRRFWGGILTDPLSPLRERIRVSELLAKSFGLFSDHRITVESAEQREQRERGEAIQALRVLEASHA